MADFGIVGLTHPKIAQGMDYWRLLVPLHHMQSLGYPVRVTRLGNDLPTFDGEPPYVLIMCETFAGTHGEERRTKKLCQNYGMLYVVDIADDPTPREDSPMQRPDGLWEAKLECIAEADLVTCNTAPMRDTLLQWNPHVEVIPDYAEAFHWDGAKPDGRPDCLTIGVRGGSTHERDWAILEEPWRKIAEDFPDVHFVSCGLKVDWFDQLPTGRYHHRPWSLIDRYQAEVKWIDIGCAPLDDNYFNLSKSPIAYYDFSLANAATVASRGTIYDQPILAAGGGHLARTTQDWIDFLAHCLTDSQWMYNAYWARDWVVKNRCMNATRCREREMIYRKHWSRRYERPTDLPEGEKSLLSSWPGTIHSTRN